MVYKEILHYVSDRVNTTWETGGKVYASIFIGDKHLLGNILDFSFNKYVYIRAKDLDILDEEGEISRYKDDEVTITLPYEHDKVEMSEVNFAEEYSAKYDHTQIYLNLGNDVLEMNVQNLDYYKYIKSERWKQKRKYLLEKVGNKCQLCGIKNVIFNVHHNSYKNLGHEDETDIIVLCRKCHARHHGKSI